MQKICEHCKKEFSITNEELGMYEKLGLELPRICFFCRVSLHFSVWPFGKFRKTKSDLSGESMITVLSAQKRYPIYTLHEWHSDAWDGIDYGKEYDPSRPFFDQMKELQEKVPRPHQGAGNSTNCDWCDDVWNSKNCYLSRSMEECEDLYYAYRVFRGKNSIDLVFCFDSNNCYDCTYCFNSYDLFYSQNSRDCMNSYFLFDCRNCSNCFMCWNLRGKSYCIENIQYSKEEYLEKIGSFQLTSFKSIQNFRIQFGEMVKKNVVHRENFNIRANNSEGEFLLDMNNAHNCFGIQFSEECYNCVRGLTDKTNIDANGCWYAEFVGNSSSCVNAYAMKYSSWSSGRFSEYLDLCKECEYCFGCVGLKNKKYCILNTQYTKEEYEALREKVIGDMKARGEYGSFFPYAMSTGPYNFSTSYSYFPEKTKEEILALGGYWEDIDETRTEGMPTAELPDDIRDVPDSIIAQALICPVSGWRFNIAQRELEFYKQKGVPLPRVHFDVRIKERMKYLTVLKPTERACVFCGKNMRVYYPKEWKYEKIACTECYQKEVA